MAEQLPAGEVLKAALDEQVYALVPNLLEQAQAKAEAKRAFRLTPTTTGWKVSGELTAECGERLHAALSAEAHRDSTNPHDTGTPTTASRCSKKRCCCATPRTTTSTPARRPCVYATDATSTNKAGS